MAQPAGSQGNGASSCRSSAGTSAKRARPPSDSRCQMNSGSAAVSWTMRSTPLAARRQMISIGGASPVASSRAKLGGYTPQWMPTRSGADLTG